MQNAYIPRGATPQMRRSIEKAFQARDLPELTSAQSKLLERLDALRAIGGTVLVGGRNIPLFGQAETTRRVLHSAGLLEPSLVNLISRKVRDVIVEDRSRSRVNELSNQYGGPMARRPVLTVDTDVGEEWVSVDYTESDDEQPALPDPWWSRVTSWTGTYEGEDVWTDEDPRLVHGTRFKGTVTLSISDEIPSAPGFAIFIGEVEGQQNDKYYDFSCTCTLSGEVRLICFDDGTYLLFWPGTVETIRTCTAEGWSGEVLCYLNGLNSLPEGPHIFPRRLGPLEGSGANKSPWYHGGRPPELQDKVRWSLVPAGSGGGGGGDPAHVKGDPVSGPHYPENDTANPLYQLWKRPRTPAEMGSWVRFSEAVINGWDNGRPRCDAALSTTLEQAQGEAHLQGQYPQHMAWLIQKLRHVQGHASNPPYPDDMD